MLDRKVISNGQPMHGEPESGLHAAMATRLNQWLEQYATLVVDAIHAKGTDTTAFSRQLRMLAVHRGRLIRHLDEFARATDPASSEAARAKAEAAWADLESNTFKLLGRNRSS